MWRWNIAKQHRRTDCSRQDVGETWQNIMWGKKAGKQYVVGGIQQSIMWVKNSGKQHVGVEYSKAFSWARVEESSSLGCNTAKHDVGEECRKACVVVEYSKAI